MASNDGKKAAKKAVKRASEKSARRAAAKATKKATKKAAPRAATGASRLCYPGNLLAKGGGAAPAAGVTFQGLAGGLFAAIGLAQDPVDQRLQLGAETVTEFHFETAAPIDDLMICTTAPGRLFVQAKTNLRMARARSGDMVKALDQMVRQWRLCSEGKRTLDWDYPLDKDHDRFVIAVGPGSPRTVAVHLAEALIRRREGSECTCFQRRPPGEPTDCDRGVISHEWLSWKNAHAAATVLKVCQARKQLRGTPT